MFLENCAANQKSKALVDRQLGGTRWLFAMPVHREFERVVRNLERARSVFALTLRENSLLAHIRTFAINGVREKTGVTRPVLLLLPLIMIAGLFVFVFLCVSAYSWLASLFNPAVGALLIAFFFALVGGAALSISTILRSRNRRSALLARQANRAAVLANPAILNIVLATGRKLGWHRAVPLASLALVAAQVIAALGARHPPRDR